ncbi:MAG: hypothetical protein P0Y55_10245 [Candidatus Cohnella colombiensis]|uniref:Uncharacterized protein n=1 Tax=Candidatus Cohnella colombiensis TaxID=3121368 RepID=A0AA95EW17_9BACL|nr:MAG: hypothetical protein P0Y55_10245 [Cohnella sp.]
MFLLSNPNGSYGVNARELAQIIQVTYKTAWLMYHKIRYAISQADSEVLLTDIVRVSDSILHQRMFQLKNWYETEQPVIAASSEDAEGNVKYVKIKLQPRPLQPIRGYPRDATSFMKQHVSPEAVYTTDISMKWGRKRQNHKLRRLCVSAAYSIATTYGGIGSKHLQAYLDQYAYIDNHFHEPIFDILLYECSTRSTITYSCLTRTAPKRSNRITRASEAMIVMSC